MGLRGSRLEVRAEVAVGHPHSDADSVLQPQAPLVAASIPGQAAVFGTQIVLRSTLLFERRIIPGASEPRGIVELHTWHACNSRVMDIDTSRMATGCALLPGPLSQYGLSRPTVRRRDLTGCFAAVKFRYSLSGVGRLLPVNSPAVSWPAFDHPLSDIVITATAFRSAIAL